MDGALIARLNAERHARRAAAVVTDLSDGRSRLVLESGFANDPLAPEIARAMSGRTGCIAVPDRGLFVNLYRPDPRLIVVGAVHITQFLAPMAALAGFAVDIVDPRGAFADEARFGGHAVTAAWPQDRFADVPPDAATGVVALSHMPDIDDQALVAGLDAGCFFVGALGSRKSHAARLERLRARGIPDAALSRIEGPVGLAIGALTPAEIAISILASVVRARRIGAGEA